MLGVKEMVEEAIESSGAKRLEPPELEDEEN